jgi:hypothetical protein
MVRHSNTVRSRRVFHRAGNWRKQRPVGHKEVLIFKNYGLMHAFDSMLFGLITRDKPLCSFNGLWARRMCDQHRRGGQPFSASVAQHSMNV